MPDGTFQPAPSREILMPDIMEKVLDEYGSTTPIVDRLAMLAVNSGTVLIPGVGWYNSVAGLVNTGLDVGDTAIKANTVYKLYDMVQEGVSTEELNNFVETQGMDRTVGDYAARIAGGYVPVGVSEYTSGAASRASGLASGASDWTPTWVSDATSGASDVASDWTPTWVSDAASGAAQKVSDTVNAGRIPTTEVILDAGREAVGLDREVFFKEAFYHSALDGAIKGWDSKRTFTDFGMKILGVKEIGDLSADMIEQIGESSAGPILKEMFKAQRDPSGNVVWRPT